MAKTNGLLVYLKANRITNVELARNLDMSSQSTWGMLRRHKSFKTLPLKFFLVISKLTGDSVETMINDLMKIEKTEKEG